MAVATKNEELKKQGKVSESSLKGIDPSAHADKYRSDDISHIIEQLTGNKLSSVMLNDIFNMLFLPHPRLREGYPEQDKDYYEMMSSLLPQIQASGIKSRTVSNVEASTVATVNIAINLIKSLEEMADGQNPRGQQGQQNQQQSGGQQQNDGSQSGQQSGNQQNANSQQGRQQSQQNQQGQQNMQQSASLSQRQDSDDINPGDQADAAELLKKLLENSAMMKELQKMLEDLRKQMQQQSRSGMMSNLSTGQVPEKAAEGAMKKGGDQNESMKDLQDRASQAGKDPGSLEFNNYDALASYISKRTDIRDLLKVLTGISNPMSTTKDDSHFTRGEYGGYEIGSDFRSIAASAYAYPKEVLFALYSQKKLPKYERVVRENEKIRYVIFDKSGSMNEQRLTFAKVVSIALYMSAAKEKADFYLTYFDSVVHQKIAVLKNAKREEQEAMINFLDSTASSGGTEIGKAIISACVDLSQDKSRKVKEIILITDGEDNLDINTVAANLKVAKADLITIYINSNSDNRYISQLRAVSKKFFIIENADKRDLLRLVSAFDEKVQHTKGLQR
jgi:uncharacterized protein with von Willebrand factor type A (vWA) domain